MRVIERLFGRAGGELPPTTVQPAGQAYPLPVPYVDGASVVALAAVWRCVTLISDTIADWPWREWRGPDDAPEPLPASRLVRRPMASMTRREWTWRVVATLTLYNVAHVLHVGGYDAEGSPWSLLPIPPDAIIPSDPLQDPWGLMPAQRYLVGDRQHALDELTIIRRAYWPTIPDHLAGVLKIARRQFGAYLAADTHLARFWQGGGPTQTVLTTDQELSDPEAAAIAQRWATRRALGSDFPAVLGKGAKAEPFGADPTTQSAVDARREMRAEVGEYFGLPARLLNAPRAGDSETYANVEDERTDLLLFCLRGFAGPVEDAISHLLPGDATVGRRMAFDPTRMLQGNLTSRATAWQALVSGQIVSRDEARRLGFGLGPLSNQTAPAPTAQDALPGALVGMGGLTDGVSA